MSKKKERLKELKIIGSSDRLTLGSIGLAHYSKECVVVYPMLGGSLLTHHEARMLAAELLKMVGKEKKEEIETKEEIKKRLRKKRRETRRKKNDKKNKSTSDVHGDGRGSRKKRDVSKTKRRRSSRT